MSPHDLISAEVGGGFSAFGRGRDVTIERAVVILILTVAAIIVLIFLARLLGVA